MPSCLKHAGHHGWLDMVPTFHCTWRETGSSGCKANAQGNYVEIAMLQSFDPTQAAT
eukprot:CAMPEP_0183409498 /NCGR_PEP_ID=MMETSP0370-20130417/18871_1 /TAXON_ID=268820 /ORGANISM="Peridinium aciculiferum, Strain PAER-2" /LENGTH=56 /DNA_ID=CAMNT_0025592187 /DNA_START=126 /DNA_END=292 /DNA_ORIENTATION=+